MKKQLKLFSCSLPDAQLSQQSFEEIEITEERINLFNEYSIESYTKDIDNFGLSYTWNLICEYIKRFGENNTILRINNFGELYETGLAHQNKLEKKGYGKYYTPEDVAKVLGEWLKECKGENICDVGCGTGNLILTYLELIGEEEALKLINERKIYLYDSDYAALQICKTAIMTKYSIKDATLINDIYCDFLDENIKLPKNAKVISNPPYTAIKEIKTSWIQTDVLLDSKELYSCFMEKIINQSVSSVIITPFSFISGNKFYSLRKEMCKIGNGFIVSFDNVPGNIFAGKKHGIFNTNTANSVRAAITVSNRDENIKGYKISPLIRFKNEERKELLVNKSLYETIPDFLQIVDDKTFAFAKIDKSLQDIFDKWKKESKYTLKDFISRNKNDYMLDIPNTCRYFTTASHRKLNRTGSIIINIQEKKIFNFIYCFINSSFAYWWWRIYDGGITYPKSLLMDLPLPINLLSEDDYLFFENHYKEMMKIENNYIVTKMNAGTEQENIKFPEEYRNEINKKILSILKIDTKYNVFAQVHSNCFKNE